MKALTQRGRSLQESGNKTGDGRDKDQSDQRRDLFAHDQRQYKDNRDKAECCYAWIEKF